MWLTFLFIVVLIAFDALADATRDDKKKLSHILQALFVLSALILAIIYPGDSLQDAIVFIILYSINRIFLFDIIYNIARKLPLDYIGSTSYWDIVINKILLKIRMAPFFLMWVKFVLWITINGGLLFEMGTLHQFTFN